MRIFLAAIKKGFLLYFKISVSRNKKSKIKQMKINKVGFSVPRKPPD